MVTLLQSAAASPQADGIFLRTSRRATIRLLVVLRIRARRVVAPEIREDKGFRIRNAEPPRLGKHRRINRPGLTQELAERSSKDGIGSAVRQRDPHRIVEVWEILAALR